MSVLFILFNTLFFEFHHKILLCDNFGIRVFYDYFIIIIKAHTISLFNIVQDFVNGCLMICCIHETIPLKSSLDSNFDHLLLSSPLHMDFIVIKLSNIDEIEVPLQSLSFP